MKKLNLNNAFLIAALALLVGAIGPWVTVLGLVNLGPTASLEVGLVVFGGIGLLVAFAFINRFMRTISILVGLMVMAEAVNVWSKVDTANEEYISTGWGLYLSILVALFLIVSTFIIPRTFMQKSNISKVSVARIED